MIKLDLLDALTDNELDQIEAYSQVLKKRRDDERKAKAMDEARAIQDEALKKAEAVLAIAGLKLKDLNGKAKGRGPKKRAYHTGHQYQHPTNKALNWNGKGKKPAWLASLEAEGKTAMEVGIA